MVSVSQQKYDGILAGIALALIAASVGMMFSPALTLSAGAIGALLMGVAMFSLDPSAPIEVDRKI
jgi:hypothetical protein